MLDTFIFKDYPAVTFFIASNPKYAEIRPEYVFHREVSGDKRRMHSGHGTWGTSAATAGERAVNITDNGKWHAYQPQRTPGTGALSHTHTHTYIYTKPGSLPEYIHQEPIFEQRNTGLAYGRNSGHLRPASYVIVHLLAPEAEER